MDLLKREDFTTEKEWYDYLGNYAEKRFGEEAALRNYEFMHTNRVHAWDGVINISNTYYKVQIKGISRNRREGRTNIFTLRLKNSANIPKYTKENIDMFAIYLLDHDHFYLVPVNEILVEPDMAGIDLFDSELDTEFKKLNDQSRTLDVSKYKIW